MIKVPQISNLKLFNMTFIKKGSQGAAVAETGIL